MCLHFWLGHAPRAFTKLLKILILLLQKTNIIVIIRVKINMRVVYLDVMLILSYTIQEAHMSRDTVMHLPKSLDFIINIKTLPENRISGYGGRFDQNEFVTDTRIATKSCHDLSEPSQESCYNSPGIDQWYRSPLIHHTGSGTWKDLVKISSTTTN